MSIQLTDSFGRIHNYLRISLTDKCNLRCLYCLPENVSFLQENRLLKSEEIIKLAGIFINSFGINKIRFTGGEPLIRNDAHELIEEISKFPVKLSITTNGILLDRFFDLFSRIKLTSLNISLDSLNQDTFYDITKRDYFRRIQRNIETALIKGFKVKINVVIIRNVNENEILDFVKWTINTDIHIRFIEFMPFLGNDWDWSKVVHSEEMMDKISDAYLLVKLNDKPNSTSESYRVKEAKGTVSFIRTVSAPFCSTCSRIRLSADGKLRNCLFAGGETDLLRALRSGQNIEDLIIKNIKSKEFAQGGKSLIEHTPRNSMVSLGG